ncbi:MAG: hypothetical protein ACI9FN_001579 [Saprospiraceae bacterium]|jgi:hypothetical protein
MFEIIAGESRLNIRKQLMLSVLFDTPSLQWTLTELKVNSSSAARHALNRARAADSPSMVRSRMMSFSN